MELDWIIRCNADVQNKRLDNLHKLLKKYYINTFHITFLATNACDLVLILVVCYLICVNINSPTSCNIENITNYTVYGTDNYAVLFHNEDNNG